MSSIQPHLPPKSHYLVGAITKVGKEYHFVRLDEEPSREGDRFLARLGALKIENHTEERLTLTVAWAWDESTGENTECVTASVPCGTWEVDGVSDPGRYGIWAALPRQLSAVRVSIEGVELRYEGSLVDFAELEVDNVSGTIILYGDGSARSRTRLFRHVYVQRNRAGSSVITISNETEHPWAGTITWKDDDGTLREEDLSRPVARGRHEYEVAPPGGSRTWYPVTLTLNNDTPYGKTQEFSLFDVDRNLVQIVQETNSEGDWSVAGPHVVTSDDKEVVVSNELPVSVDAWPMGYKVGNSNSSVVTIEPDGQRAFTMVEEGSTANDQVPFRGPGPAQDPTAFQRQAALNWLASGDPKVVIRQNDCGSGG